MPPGPFRKGRSLIPAHADDRLFRLIEPPLAPVRWLFDFAADRLHVLLVLRIRDRITRQPERARDFDGVLRTFVAVPLWFVLRRSHQKLPGRDPHVRDARPIFDPHSAGLFRRDSAHDIGRRLN